MKYLLDFTVYAGGGSSTYAEGFLRELSQREPPAGGCAVLLPPDGFALVGEETLLRESGYRVVRPPAGPPGAKRSSMWRQIRLPILARQLGARVVFVPRDIAPLLIPCRLVILTRNLVVWRRGSERGGREAASWLLRNSLGRASTRRARIVLATTAAFAESVSADPDKVRVVHHGCDLAAIEPKRRPPGDGRSAPLTVTCLGTIYPHKRYDIVIRAVHELRQCGVDAHLDIWGDTSYEQEVGRLRALAIETLGYDPLRGPLPGDRRAAALARSDVLAMGSSYESFGLPMVEGMRTSTIVWAPASALVTELCQGSCVTYREGDHVDAARQLQAALPDAAALLAEGTRRSAHFTWKRCVDQTLSALAEAADGH